MCGGVRFYAGKLRSYAEKYTFARKNDMLARKNRDLRVKINPMLKYRCSMLILE